MIRNHSLSTTKKDFDLIKSGQKTLVIFPVSDATSRIRKGDTISFPQHSLAKFTVTQIKKYKNTAELLKFEDCSQLMPEADKKQVFSKLQELYSEKKYPQGLFLFSISRDKKNIVYIFGNSFLKRKGNILFSNLITLAYSATDYLNTSYPNHFKWYWTEAVPNIINGNGDIIICLIDSKVAGVLIWQKECDNYRISLLFTDIDFQNYGIEEALLIKAFKIFGNEKPIINISEFDFYRLKSIIEKYHWENTQIFEKGVYCKFSREFVFNGKLPIQNL